MVDRCQAGDMQQEFVQKIDIHVIAFCRDGWFIGENNRLYAERERQIENEKVAPFDPALSVLYLCTGGIR